MDQTMSDVLMEPFLYDVENILDPLCQCCAIPFYQCMRAVPQAPYVAAQMFYSNSHAFHSPVPDVHQTAADLAPVVEYVNETHKQQRVDECVNVNETTIQPTTIHAHIQDIYTPGDRLVKPRRTPHRRQAPRAHGYPCLYEGCAKAFDRACELNRHKKTHLDHSERPHQCDLCNEGFLYPKDLVRHQRKHIAQPSAKNTFYCPFSGCSNLEGFSRRDNLLRHKRKQHPTMPPSHSP